MTDASVIVPFLAALVGNVGGQSGQLLHATVVESGGDGERVSEVWALPRFGAWEVYDKTNEERRTHNPVHGLLIEDGKKRQVFPAEFGRAYPVPLAAQMLIPSAMPIWRVSDTWAVESVEPNSDILTMSLVSQDPAYDVRSVVQVSNSGVVMSFSYEGFEAALTSLEVQGERSRPSIWWGA